MLGAQAMADQRFDQWLIPQLNGQPRFQKPPLATWLAAGAFVILGESDFAGRLPNVLGGWLTLIIVYLWAAAIANARAGLIAAGGLLGSLYFLRFTRLAETDGAAMPWVMLAFFAIWQAVRRPHGNLAQAAWFHLAAAAAGLATMSKGGPGALPILYLVALAIVGRSMHPIVQFLRSGALLSYAIIAVPWFAFIWLNADARNVLEHEASVILRGGEHIGPFYDYFIWIAVGCIPWTAFGIAAIYRAVRNVRHDPPAADLVAAVLSVLIPLLLLGQKQPHYLLSLVPILFLITGVQTESMLRNESSRRGLGKLIIATIAVTILIGIAAIGLSVAGPAELRMATFVLAGLLLGGAAAGIGLFVRRGAWPAIATLGAVMPLIMLVSTTSVVPGYKPSSDARQIATRIREQVGSAPLAWSGKNESLAVTYYLRQVVPTYDLDPATAVPAPPADAVLIEFKALATVGSPPNGYRQLSIGAYDDSQVTVLVPIPGPAEARTDLD